MWSMTDGPSALTERKQGKRIRSDEFNSLSPSLSLEPRRLEACGALGCVLRELPADNRWGHETITTQKLHAFLHARARAPVWAGQRVHAGTQPIRKCPWRFLCGAQPVQRGTKANGKNALKTCVFGAVSLQASCGGAPASNQCALRR